jgi:GxxExxY protein
MPLNAEITEFTEKSTESALNALSGLIIDCGFHIHKKLGPGLLESAYKHSLAYYLPQKGIMFSCEKTIPIKIDDHVIDAGYRADIIVESKIIVEIKAVEKIIPVHEAQLLTYMRLGHYNLGLILNFNTLLFKDGIKRMRL